MKKSITTDKTYINHFNNHINVCENQVCSSCVIDKFLITKRVRYWSDDEDDQDDDHDSRVSPDFNAQKLHRINQRKGLCFIQASSDDKDDKDDDLIAPIAFQDFSRLV